MTLPILAADDPQTVPAWLQIGQNVVVLILAPILALAAGWLDRRVRRGNEVKAADVGEWQKLLDAQREAAEENIRAQERRHNRDLARTQRDLKAANDRANLQDHRIDELEAAARASEARERRCQERLEVLEKRQAGGPPP